MPNSAYFTAEDVAYIRGESTAEAKIAIAEKLGYHFQQLARTSTAFQLAVEIAMLLQKDKDTEVRAALAKNIAREPKTPITLAALLGTDPVVEVAAPILRHSPKFSDTILLPLIHATQTIERLLAIAERGQLSSPACQALISKRIEEVCLAVIHRHAHAFDAECYAMVLHHYGKNVAVLTALQAQTLKHASKISKPLVRVLDQAIHAAAANDAGPAPDHTAAAVTLSDWRWRMEQYAQDVQSPAWGDFAETLNREGALQAPTMLLALGLGLVPLFVACMARHGRRELAEAELACQGTEQDFRQLYQFSHLPSALYKFCWWSLSSCRELLARGTAPMSEEMRRGMVRKFAQAEKLKINFAATVGHPIVETLQLESPHHR